MTPRRGAVAAGVVLIAVAVATFSLARHPVIAGNNGIQPLFDTLFLDHGIKYCQQVPSLPADVSKVELAVTRSSGPASVLRFVLVGPDGRIARGRLPQLTPGGHIVRLDRPTPPHPVRHAGACFESTGDGQIVIAGETKRCSPRDTHRGVTAPCIHPEEKPRGEKYRWLAGLRFLRDGSTSWLSEADVILARFRLSQAGWFGTWAAWLAAALAVAATALALWWLARRPEAS
jgi:hypothetical protein